MAICSRKGNTPPVSSIKVINALSTVADIDMAGGALLRERDVQWTDDGQRRHQRPFVNTNNSVEKRQLRFERFITGLIV